MKPLRPQGANFQLEAEDEREGPPNGNGAQQRPRSSWQEGAGHGAA
jgi:hypothetical protein